MNRRSFLASAAVAASAALSGCPSDTPSSTPPDGTITPTDERTAQWWRDRQGVDAPHADRYGTVVDVVEAGADDGGQEPIDGVLRDAVADDTLVHFPPGRYRLSSAVELHDFERVGIVGRDATVVPPPGYAGYLFVVGRPGGASDFLLEGLTFDFTAEGTGPRAIQARVDDGLVVRDVTVRGRQDTDTGLTRFDVTSPAGTGEITRLRLPDGGKPGTVATGCLVGPSSTGHLTFRDCRIAGFPDNGLYASPATGRVTVKGGTYANSGVANVRVSGPSLVEGVTVRCDRSVDGIANMRGIRLRGGDGAVVRNCEVDFRAVNQSDGAIVLSSETGRATVEDTAVRIDTDGVAALRAKNPGQYDGGGGKALRCRGLTVTGSAADGSAVRVTERPASILEGLCIHQTGDGRDGVVLRRSGDTRVAGSISVPGAPIVVHGAGSVVSSIERAARGCDGAGGRGPRRSEPPGRLDD